MERLLITLVILTGLLGSAGAVWADAEDDFYKGYKAYQAGDYAEALKWYRKAAEQGYASAQHNLGNSYSKGEGVTQDYAEAVKWYRKAAEQGYARAQYNLALRYDNGEGVTQDNITAHMWHNIAAENGNKRAVEGRDKVAKTLTVEQLVKANEQEERCIGNSNSTYFGKVIAYRDCDTKAKSW